MYICVCMYSFIHLFGMQSLDLDAGDFDLYINKYIYIYIYIYCFLFIA